MVSCFKNTSDVTCRTKCSEVLDCDHVCVGTCGGCKQSRLHRKCAAKCERVLVCSHLCAEPCTKDCPPCSKKCENRCFHSKFERICGEQCVQCMEECTWRCVHKKCSRRCSERCDRDACNEPCRKLLSCKHACIGLCGEVCPKVCRVCDKDKVEEILFGEEDEPGARFIHLEDCEHFFEVNSFDRWMRQDNGDEKNVKLKECPRCKTIIRKSVRYGNIVKDVLKDINAIKMKIIQGD